MAPRTRSNRTEILERRKLLASGVSVNTHGLAALPNELYLEILIHLPAIPIPQDAWMIDEEPDAYRQLTLYYLSQTCRSLRKFFLRYAWERIEVFGGMWTPKGRLATQVERNKHGTGKKELVEKQLVEEVLRQLETVVVRNPDLGQYVSTVNLTLLRHSHDSVLPKIAQNLSLFPDLHTLRLKFCFYYPVDPSPLFSAYRYPNVHTLDISHMSPRIDILRACPNTKHLSFFKDDGEFHLWYLSISECAGGLETLGVLLGLEYTVAAVVKCFPRLRDLSLDSQNLRGCPNLDLLSSLPLHTLRLLLDTRPLYLPSSVTLATPDERRRWIDLAKGILANCPQHDPKRVMVVNFDKTVDVCYV